MKRFMVVVAALNIGSAVYQVMSGNAAIAGFNAGAAGLCILVIVTSSDRCA